MASSGKEKKPLIKYGSKGSQDDSQIHRSDLHGPHLSSLPSTTGTSSYSESWTGMTAGEVAQSNDMSLKEDGAEHRDILDSHFTAPGVLMRGASTVFVPSEMAIGDGSLSKPLDNIPEHSEGSKMLLTAPEASKVQESLAKSAHSKLQQDSEDARLDSHSSNSKKRPRFLLDLPDLCAVENKSIADDCHFPNKRARTEKEKSGKQPCLDETVDELSLSGAKQQPTITASKHSKVKRVRDEDELEDRLYSDNVTTDLPVEKYQPRPSRSRSGQLDADLLVPVDFSKRPEATVKGKRKNKRRKTTAFEQLVHEEDEMDVFQVNIASLKHAEPLIPVAKVDDVEERFIEPLIPPSKVNDEAANLNSARVDLLEEGLKAPPAKKRGRPKKQVQEARDREEPIQDPSSPTKSSKIAPSSRLTKRKAKISTSLDSDLSSAEENPLPQNSDPPNPDISQPYPPPFTVRPPQPSPTHSHKAPSSPNKTRSPSPSNITNTINPDLKAHPTLQTPPKPARGSYGNGNGNGDGNSSHKGPDKHSPISSGKVAYRVGLSKRARIEPLLRILRK